MTQVTDERPAEAPAPPRTAHAADGASSRRDPRVDQARGVASLIMIQGHAFDGWVAAEHRSGGAYAAVGLFQSLPLPAFLVLAGTAVAYRMGAAQRRGESARSLRAGLVRRGLQILAAGYGVSLGYALLDGWASWAVALRADVLHVIGLSIALLGLCMGGGAHPPPRGATVAGRVLALGALSALLCPWLTRWASGLAPSDGPGVYPLSLLVAVPDIGQMPLSPLFAWAAAGFWAGLVMQRDTGPGPGSPRPRGNPPDGAPGSPGQSLPGRSLLGLSLLGLSLAFVGSLATDGMVERLGGDLTRAHAAVIANTLDYGGRGLLVLGAAPLLVGRLPMAVQGFVMDFGRASLWAYVFHIPFCYGRLGAPLRDRLAVGTAAPYIVVLIALSYGVVWLRLRAGPGRPPRAPADAAIRP